MVRGSFFSLLLLIASCFFLVSCALKKPLPKTVSECTAAFKDDLDKKLDCWSEVTGYSGEDAVGDWYRRKGADNVTSKVSPDNTQASNTESTRSPSNNSSDRALKDLKMERAKSDCSKIFKVATKDYGNCVMELID